jgi:multiple sugar transport system ATP-binding protein
MSLVLENVVKRFKGEVVLDGVSLAVESGETLVLFGPSGAGKTVLLRLIAGVVEPDAGPHAAPRRDMAGVEPEDRGVGMAFQNFALFPHMDAFANIASPLEARRQARGAIREGVERVASSSRSSTSWSTSPARCPTAKSSAPRSPARWWRSRRSCCSTTRCATWTRSCASRCGWSCRACSPIQGATVIYVTQDYKEAMALGRRIAVMNRHGVRQVAPPRRSISAPPTRKSRAFSANPVINLLDGRPSAASAAFRPAFPVSPCPCRPAHEALHRASLASSACAPRRCASSRAARRARSRWRSRPRPPLNEKTVTLGAHRGRARDHGLAPGRDARARPRRGLRRGGHAPRHALRPRHRRAHRARARRHAGRSRMTAQLRLEAVDKFYGAIDRGVHAVRGVDMEVEKGEIIALLGSSGCGKTSTLRMIAGFESVSRGRIFVAGREVQILPPVRRNVAMAFEGYSLYPTVTVRDNIAFALKAARLPAEMVARRVERSRRYA